MQSQVCLTPGLKESSLGSWREREERMLIVEIRQDGAEKAICENVWLYLRKINSAYNFIMIPFLETLTPINVVKIWEATKCLFFFSNLLLSINIYFLGRPRFPLSPLGLLILNLERPVVTPQVVVA